MSFEPGQGGVTPKGLGRHAYQKVGLSTLSPRSAPGNFTETSVLLREGSLRHTAMLPHTAAYAASKACATRHSAGLLPPTRPPPHVKRPDPPEGMIRILVVTPRKGQYELEVPETSTADDVCRHLAERKQVHVAPGGPMVPRAQDQAALRLLFRGTPLKSDASLVDLGLENGCSLRALPALGECRSGLHNAAPRGLLMTSNRPWAPSQSREPLTVLPLETEGPYSANLRHPVLVPSPQLPMPK
mmetsp:Transcript_89653/g.159236  ORF Transcript_89653/g.159236 Transcript_89653/m.159236 type:complete len:243 (+) Transcript_89653:60-788(+)